MKKLMLLVCISLIVISSSCNNNSETPNTHQHDDGSTHSDHDTTKPVQQEFKVTDTIKKDTTTHSHDDGKKHSH